MELTDTLDVWISGTSWFAGTFRLMVASETSRGRCAGVVVANGTANSVQTIASFVVGAILVVMTNSRYTRYVRISLSSTRTRALSAMSSSRAFGSTSTNYLAKEAGRCAVTVSACFVIRTLIVRFTFRYANEKKVNN